MLSGLSTGLPVVAQPTKTQKVKPYDYQEAHADRIIRILTKPTNQVTAILDKAINIITSLKLTLHRFVVPPKVKKDFKIVRDNLVNHKVELDNIMEIYGQALAKINTLALNLAYEPTVLAVHEKIMNLIDLVKQEYNKIYPTITENYAPIAEIQTLITNIDTLKNNFYTLDDLVTNQISGVSFRSMVDNSTPGHGKTPNAVGILERLEQYYQTEYELFIVAAPTIQAVWERETKKYGVKVLAIFSPQSFAGTYKGFSHGFLTNTNGNRDKDNVNIGVTPYMMNLLRTKNILFIYDEFDFGKNPARAQHSIVAITQAIDSIRDTKSRSLFLSGTPIDKSNLTIGLLKMLGLVHHDTYVTYNIQEGYNITGLDDVYNIAHRINPELADEIYGNTNTFNVSKDKATNIGYELWHEILKPLLVSNMPKQDFEATQYRYDGEFYVPIKIRPALTEAIAELKKAVGFKESDGTVNIKKGTFGMITRAMVKINSASAPLVLYQALRVLSSDPKAKVLIFTTYSGEYDWIIQNLREYQIPLVAMNGETPQSSRTDYITRFQQPNQNVRALIAQVKVGGRGASMNSTKTLKKGGYTAFTFIVPNFHYSDQTQAVYRTYRADSKADSYVFFVYGDKRQVGELTNVLAAMQRKKTELQKYVQYGEKDILPGEYTRFVEYDNLPTTDPEDYLQIMYGLNLPPPEVTVDEEKEVVSSFDADF